MRRSTTMLVGLAAAGSVFLAGCGGSDTAAPSTSAAQTSAAASVSPSSSASGSAAGITTPSALPSTSTASGTAGSTAPSTSTARPTATTTVGGDVTSLDPTSAAWFDTFCSGMAPLGELTQNSDQITGPAQLGTAMTRLGDAMTATSAALGALPVPTFEGGDALAARTIEGLGRFGPLMTAAGGKAAAIDPADTAAGEQLLTDLQSTFAELPQIVSFDVSPELRRAIATVPSCAALVPAA